MRRSALRTLVVGSVLIVLAGAGRPATGVPPADENRKDAPRVVVSLKPLHAVVAAVMEDAGEPELLLPGAAATPHGYSLRPSQMRMLTHADVVFWVGPELETFLEASLANLPGEVRVVSLLRNLLDLLERRRREGRPGTGRPLAADSEPALWTNRTPEHWDEFERYTGPPRIPDPHIWLDPVNAAAIAEIVSEILGKADPSRAELYSANAERFRTEMIALRERMAKRLAPVGERPFIVYHDSYQYLERRFGLNAVAAVTRGTHVNPGAAHLRRLRDLLESGGAVCVFIEPQFSPRLARTLVSGTPARLGTLDPLGGSLPEGPDHLNRLLENLVRALTDCLDTNLPSTP